MPTTIKRPWIATVTSDDEAGGQAPTSGDAVTKPTEQTPPAQAGGKTYSDDDVQRIVQERLTRQAAALTAEHAEAKAKAAKYDEAQEAAKTDQERAAEALAAAKAEAEAARAETVRYRVAATHGITGDDLDLLGTGAEAELTARAERLADLLAAEKADQARQTAAPVTGQPRPVLHRGAAPVDTAPVVSSADAAREAAIRRGQVAPADKN